MSAPDSSVVVENPEFEYDEDGRPMEADEQPVVQAEDELSAAEVREMSFLMYSSLKEQSYLYAAFKNSSLGLTCGLGMRASLAESLASQSTNATSLLHAPNLAAVSIDPALLAHAKATTSRIASLQAAKNLDELPELFSGLGDEEEVCAAGTSEAIHHAVENGTPISLFAVGAQAHVLQWEGQLYLQLNPKMQRLEVVAFRYVCAPQADDVALFDSAPRSKRAMRRLFELQARFQVSHILRATITLDTVAAVAFGSAVGQSDLAILTLDVSAAPQLARRRVNSTVHAGNTWRPTRDWTKGHAASTSGRYSFVGHTDVLQYLVSMMAAANENIAALLAGSHASLAGPAPTVAAMPSASAASGPGASHRAAGLENVPTEGSDSEGELTLGGQ